MIVENTYKIKLPDTPFNTTSFSFNFEAGGQNFDITFKYFKNHWRLWLKLSDARIYDMIVLPGVLGFSDNPDVGLFWQDLGMIKKSNINDQALFYIKYV